MLAIASYQSSYQYQGRLGARILKIGAGTWVSAHYSGCYYVTPLIYNTRGWSPRYLKLGGSRSLAAASPLKTPLLSRFARSYLAKLDIMRSYGVADASHPIRMLIFVSGLRPSYTSGYHLRRTTSSGF